MRNSVNPPLDEAVDAVLGRTSNPKTGSVVPAANQGAIAIRKLMDEIGQLNSDHVHLFA
jgi:hypothetical protein